MTVTLDDISCLLHLSIRGRFLNHERIGKEDVLVEMLGVTPESGLEEIDKTRGSHVRCSYLARVFEKEVQCAREADGDAEQGWILQHFPCISGWSLVEGYTEDKPRACAYDPLRGNQAIESFRLYIDRLTHEDVYFSSYEDHCETIPFDDASLFKGWLACRIRKTTVYMPKRVMRQFGFTQTILWNPAVVPPPTVRQRDMNELFDDFENHLVLEEARNIVPV
ncbi:uncharacterized protein LOC131659157 [Vicia villosa]|uniref:uncharacterized protein LOC131659157 n=1 Tax=Vicia villosa TaxID=3911 RepID=UPI00273BE771|nr:uncharacterized protein LOC131659157 [Vicia villosa]